MRLKLEDLPRSLQAQARAQLWEGTKPSAAPQQPKPPSYSEAVVSAWFAECGLPLPVYEYPHIPGRKFRLDVAWPDHKVGVEVQGGIWTKAAHSTGAGIKRDMEKRNLGLCAGWRVLECEPSELCTQAVAGMVRVLICTERIRRDEMREMRKRVDDGRRAEQRAMPTM